MWGRVSGTSAQYGVLLQSRTIADNSVAYGTISSKFGSRMNSGRGKGWERLAPFFDYTPAIRKVVYTTNTIESLSPHRTIKPLTQLSGHAPNHLSSHLLWSGPFIPCNCNEWLIHTPKGQTTHVAIRQGGTVSE